MTALRGNSRSIELKDIEHALTDVRPSVPLEERRRYARIYARFKGSRAADFPMTEAGDEGLKQRTAALEVVNGGGCSSYSHLSIYSVLNYQRRLSLSLETSFPKEVHTHSKIEIIEKKKKKTTTTTTTTTKTAINPQKRTFHTFPAHREDSPKFESRPHIAFFRRKLKKMRKGGNKKGGGSHLTHRYERRSRISHRN